MTTIVSRNTIKLAGTASATANFYVGYKVVFTRLDKITGKETVQTGNIIGYDGTSKVATIDTLWEETIIPGAETTEKKDSYKIVPVYPDSRVSINPAIQSMDYITSNRYGRGLNPMKDLHLPSWLDTARVCDTQSDVTVEVIGALPALGDVYTLTASTFQGRVFAISGQFVTFSEVHGKLTHKWNSWKSFPASGLLYHENNLYSISSGGVKTVAPTHTSGTVNGMLYLSAAALNKVSGTGPASLGITTNGNPVRARKNGTGPLISGYSLYDADGIDYWRYAGWDGHDQRYVTRHQTNLTIDTSVPLFDNMNSLLEHFGGILRYNNGQYYLEIEADEGNIPSTDTEPRNINDDSIIGKIRITDEGIRSSYNSLTVSFADPANKFEARNISFFNSEYLKADRNVPRKGNISIPGITNYYNARLASDKFLSQSRYGLSVTFNMAPRGALLLAGRVIQLSNPRYGWNNKKFRISDLTHNTDTTVDIVADEYDDSFYAVKRVSQPPGTGLAGETNNTTIGSPTALVTTSVNSNNETVSAIELKWQNSPAANSTFVTTEIYASSSASLYVTVSAIAAGNILTTTAAHGLKVGDVITAKATANGLINDTAYYVIEVPSATTFKLSTDRGGTVISNLTNGSSLSILILTANMIANVPVPENTFVDTYTGTGSDRVDRYYWVRHRIYEE